MCLRGGLGGWRFRVVSRTISAARQARPPADDVHHHPGEMQPSSSAFTSASAWETSPHPFLIPPKRPLLFAGDGQMEK